MEQQLEKLTVGITAEFVRRGMNFDLSFIPGAVEFKAGDLTIQAHIQTVAQIQVVFDGYRKATWTVTDAKKGGTAVKAAIEWLFGDTAAGRHI